MMIVAGTGHRPEKCDESDVRKKVEHVFKTAPVGVFISGVAAGYDLWAADVALDLGVELWVARPWKGHQPRLADAALYAKVIAGASKVFNVSEELEYPGPWIYQKRNEFMVDNATHVLAYWDGTRGGTYNCVKYAEKKLVPIRNIYG